MMVIYRLANRKIFEKGLLNCENIITLSDLQNIQTNMVLTSTFSIYSSLSVLRRLLRLFCHSYKMRFCFDVFGTRNVKKTF